MTRKKSKSPNPNKYKKTLKRFVEFSKSRWSIVTKRMKSWRLTLVKHVQSWWTIIGVIATLLGFVMDLGGCRSYLVSFTKPKLEIAYFTKDDNGHLIISDDGYVDLNLTQEDFDNGTVQVPLNFAIRNLGNETLEDVRIHVKYGKDFEVIPMGAPQIDATGRQLIYEHNIGLLEPINTYTPLETIDIIRIPFTFRLLPFVTLYKGEIPVYIQMVLGAGSDNETEKIFALDIDIFSKDRSPINGTVYLRVPLGLDIIGDDEGKGEYAPMSPTDEIFFAQASVQTEGTVDYWEKFEEAVNKVITYRKIKTSTSIFQVISVNQQVRRIIVDEDSDQLVDYEFYVPADENGVIQKLVHLDGKKKMVTWLKEPTKIR